MREEAVFFDLSLSTLNRILQLKGSLWGIHHGGVPQAFSAGGHCDDSGGQHTKETPAGS